MLNHIRSIVGFSGIFAVLIGTSGCGPQESKSTEDQQPIVLQVSSLNPPKTYTLADPDCQIDTTPVQLQDTVLSRWTGLSLTSDRITLNKVSSGVSLTSSPIASTNYGLELTRICDPTYSKVGKACRNEAGTPVGVFSQTRNKGGYLRVCQSQSTFNRDTYEAAALSGIHYINGAHQSYLEFAGPEAKIERIDLSTLPIFRTIYKDSPTQEGPRNLGVYFVNNLAYMPDSKMIVIFPESSKSGKSNTGALWESPFVLAHEYGHHVELQISGDFFQRYQTEWNPLEHTFAGSLMDPASKYALSDKTQSEQNALRLQTAVSEGFADLLAFYAVTGDSSSIVGLPCFGYNRDPSNSQYRNGSAKILDLAALSAFFTAEKNDILAANSLAAQESPCDQPPNAEAHTIGGLLAHGIQRIFNDMDQAMNLSGGASLTRLQSALRYRVTMAWLKEMRANNANLIGDLSSQHPGATLQPLLTHLETAMASMFTGQSPAVILSGKIAACKASKEWWSASPRPLFSSTDGQCPAESNPQ